MPLAIIELSLRIALAALEGQTPEQRAKIWDWHIANMERLHKLLKLDA